MSLNVLHNTILVGLCNCSLEKEKDKQMAEEGEQEPPMAVEEEQEPPVVAEEEEQGPPKPPVSAASYGVRFERFRWKDLSVAAVPRGTAQQRGI